MSYSGYISGSTEPIENPYGLPAEWVAVPRSLIQRAKDMMMDVCNSHTGYAPEEIYCPQIDAAHARELNDALRDALEAHTHNNRKDI